MAVEEEVSSSQEMLQPSADLVNVSIETAEFATVRLEIPFASPNDARIAYNSLRIDKEPPRGNVVKELTVRDEFLLVKISSKEVRKLRSAVTSFMDYVILVVNTLEKFGPSCNNI